MLGLEPFRNLIGTSEPAPGRAFSSQKAGPVGAGKGLREWRDFQQEGMFMSFMTFWAFWKHWPSASSLLIALPVACTSQRREEAPRPLPLQPGSLGLHQAAAPLARHAHFTTWPFHVLETLLEHVLCCRPWLPQPVGWISPSPGSLPWPRPRLHSTLGNSMNPTEAGPDRFPLSH